ncbi:MAG TPA: BON domain-containing protein [Clostridia bacterium]|nr:BON domain-containing protein [Clostridia bacterium]
MKIAGRSLKTIGMLGLATLAIALAGCAKGDRTTGQAWSDRMTERRVKGALGDAPVFKYPDVAVNVYEGNAQLTGFVATEEQRLQAADIASRVNGVDQVINNIMIKPTPTGPATIRDPLGRETGRVMLETNAPSPQPLRMQPSGTAPNNTGTQSNPQLQDNQNQNNNPSNP